MSKIMMKHGSIRSDRDSIADWVVRGMSSIEYKDRKGRLWASDAGLCERQAVLNATFKGNVLTTATTQTYYSEGTCLETLATDALYKVGLLLYKEYKLPDIGLNLGGYVDGIVHIGGKVRVLEIKSCGAIPSKPKPAHAAQAAVYSAITGFPATILYFSRNVAKWDGKLIIQDFDLAEDEELKKQLLFRVVYSSLATKNKVVPDKPMHILKESHCGFCGYKETCWRDAPIPDHGIGKIDEITHMRILEEANKITNRLLDPDVATYRWNGIMKFLSVHGNKHAKNLLSKGNWDKYF